MRIESLRIGAKTYAIQPTSPAVLADDARQADVCHRTAVIRVASEGSAPHLASLIVHESLHALFDDTGIDLPPAEEERMVSVLTPRLTAFLADNPAAVRELLSMLGCDE